MIDHIVMLRCPASETLSGVMRGLAGLVKDIAGFDSFTHGANVDVEGKSPDHPYGFICRFEDRASLDRYATDPRHKALGAQLVALCGGADGIMVYDISS